LRRLDFELADATIGNGVLAQRHYGDPYRSVARRATAVEACANHWSSCSTAGRVPGLYRMLWTGGVSDDMAGLLTPLARAYEAGKL
jgi:hypothetical protein